MSSSNSVPMEQKQQISLPHKLTIQHQHHQQYALKWSDFQSSILTCFQRLRDEEDFVDVTLSCDQRSFAAHRVVLSACSPYFRKLLKSNPCKHPIVILKDVHSENMECLLSFMYNGEVNVRHDQLPDFLRTAHLLQIRGLTDVSENWRSAGCISSEDKSIDTLSANETCKRDSDRDICEIEPDEKSNYSSKYKSPAELPMTSSMVSNSSITSVNVPVTKETKASNAACHQWENSDVFRKHHLTPPPQKRIKSADLFRAQHGISSERALSEKDFPSFIHHSLSREQRPKDGSEMNLSFSAEEKRQSHNQYTDIESKQEESSDDESRSSNDDNSERDDKDHIMNNSSNHQRAALHNIFLGGPKSLEDQSALNLNDYGTQRSVEMRVRATDPRPCPKCGKIYRSAHTLRTHLEDKHTVCPGYRCVLCGTVAKSRNSLHSHMSRQHRGVSTKDLPVLPMPCPFDPVLASRLLAKAGVKISAENLHDSASPSYSSRHNMEACEKKMESDDDAEDLTAAGSARFSTVSNADDDKHKRMLGFGHDDATIARIRNEAAIAAAAAALSKHKEMSLGQSAPNQPLLDLHLLQFITENTFGMGMTPDHTAAATLHAAKLSQLNAMGQDYENLPATLMSAHFNLPKESIAKETYSNKGCVDAGLSSEPILRQQLSSSVSLNENIQTLAASMAKNQNYSEVALSNDEDQSKQGVNDFDNKQHTSYRTAENLRNERAQSEGSTSPKA